MCVHKEIGHNDDLLCPKQWAATNVGFVKSEGFYEMLPEECAIYSFYITRELCYQWHRAPCWGCHFSLTSIKFYLKIQPILKTLAQHWVFIKGIHRHIKQNSHIIQKPER